MLPPLVLSLLAGALVAMAFYGASPTEVIRVATEGYTARTGNQLVDGLLSRGGLESMFETIALIICALTLGTGNVFVALGAWPPALPAVLHPRRRHRLRDLPPAQQRP
jgi:Na+/H+ antiporter NhaC